MVFVSVFLFFSLLFALCSELIYSSTLPPSVSSPPGNDISIAEVYTVIGVICLVLVSFMIYIIYDKAIAFNFTQIPFQSYWLSGGRKLMSLEIACSHMLTLNNCLLFSLTVTVQVVFSNLKHCQNSCDSWLTGWITFNLFIILIAVIISRWSMSRFYAYFTDKEALISDEFKSSMERSVDKSEPLLEEEVNRWHYGVFYIDPNSSNIVIKERYPGTGIVPYICTFNLGQDNGKICAGLVVFGLVGVFVAMGAVLSTS